MAIKFDPNRVGPGTFELVRDASTGTYSLKEVGFTKLQSLTLPDLTPTTTTTTPTQTQTQTKPDTKDTTQPILPQVGGKDRDGSIDRINISTIPTPGGAMDDAAKVSENLQSGFLASGAAGGARLPSTTPQEGFLASGAAGSASLGVNENQIDRGNPTGDPRIVSEEQGLAGKPAMLGDTGGSMNQMSGVTPRVPDAIKFGQISPPDQTIISKATSKAKDVISNLKPVSLRIVDTISSAITSPEQQALNIANKNALSAVGYKTNSELGISTDPGRIAGNPADNVFAGMNAQSATGDIMTGSANRIKTRETVGIQKVEARYGKDSRQAKDFRAKTETYKNQRQEVFDAKEREQAKKNKADLAKGPGALGPAGGAGNQGNGGKSIVCTAMYQTTGLQDWAKAMKIWYIYQKRYLTMQHQEGYHKLFKPFVKAMHKSNIVKAIGAHFAKHRTQHLKHVLFKSKPSLLGKVYSKVLETICYWAGKK